jgi:hypothetical protein
MPGANREIHRPLSLTTPNQTGPDVSELQESINADFSGFKLPGRVDVDGEFGPQTKRRANRILYLLGADPQGEGLAGPLFTQAEQKVIRNPESRTKEQKERSERRVQQAHAALERHGKGAAAAVKWALSQKGVTEHPLGSNRGPEVDAWTRFCRLEPPVFWCGCFASYAAVHEGGAKVDPFDLIHNEVMLTLADQGGRGLERVSIAEARTGDIVSFTFHHIGMLVEPVKDGRLHTIEGNTGQQGLQNNGGGVYEHTDRTTGLVLGIVRPDYS